MLKIRKIGAWNLSIAVNLFGRSIDEGGNIKIQCKITHFF